MPKLLLTILAATFLVACTPTSVEPNEETATDNFERNLECQKLKEERQKDFAGEIKSIFYSPDLNSCLEFYTIQDGPSDTFMILRDTFTNEFILKEKLTERGDYENFQEKIAEYQN